MASAYPLHGLSDAEGKIALQITSRYLTSLHQAQPTWTISRLLQELAIPDMPWLRQLAIKSGFSEEVGDETCANAIEAMHRCGVWSPDVISDETGLAREVVANVLVGMTGYGTGAFGTSSYGGHNRKVSIGDTPALRRVSVMGQMSYRRHTYSLGTPYRGRIAHIIETTRELHVAFGDRPSLLLTARHERSG